MMRCPLYPRKQTCAAQCSAAAVNFYFCFGYGSPAVPGPYFAGGVQPNPPGIGTGSGTGTCAGGGALQPGPVSFTPNPALPIISVAAALTSTVIAFLNSAATPQVAASLIASGSVIVV